MPRITRSADMGDPTLGRAGNAAQINIGVASKIGQSGKAMGRAIESVGNAFGEIAGRMQTANDRTNFSRAQLEYNKFDQKTQIDLNNSVGEDGSGYETAPELYSKGVAAIREKYRVSDPARQEKLDLWLEQRATNRGFEAARKKQSAASKYYKTREDTEIAGAEQQLLNNPSMEQFNALLEPLSGMIGSGEGVYHTKADVQRRQRELRGRLTMSMLEGLRKKDPEAAKMLLDKIAKGQFTQDTQSSAYGVPKASGSGTGRSTSNNTFARRAAKWSGLIGKHARAHGVDPGVAQTLAGIESGGNPNNTTGSYKGLFQLSNSEFRKYGGRGNIYNPAENTRVAMKKLAANSRSMSKKLGRAPTATELYMWHQQGAGGSIAHLTAPNRKAWQSMYSTGEGKGKGARWSKLAIWGNVPPKYKKMWGSVENVSSAEFVAMWTAKVEGVPYKQALSNILSGKAGGGTATGQAAAGNDNVPENNREPIAPPTTEDLIKAAQETGNKEAEMLLGDTPEELDEETRNKLIDHIQDKQPQSAGRVGAIAQGARAPAIAADELPQGNLAGNQSFKVKSKFGNIRITSKMLNSIRRKQLKSYRRAINEEVKIRQREGEVMADDMMAKQLATVESSGKDAKDWDAATVKDIYKKNPKKIAAFNRKIEIAKMYHSALQDAGDLDNDTLRERADLLRREAEQEGGTDPEILKAADKAERQVEAIARQRRSDPAKAVAISREVKRAYGNMPKGKPTTNKEYFLLIDARIKAQRRLNMNVSPVTRDEADQILRHVVEAPARDMRNVAKKMMSNLRSMFGPHADLVLQSAIRLSNTETKSQGDALANALKKVIRTTGDDPKFVRRFEELSQINDIDKAMGQDEAPPKRNTFDDFD